MESGRVRLHRRFETSNVPRGCTISVRTPTELATGGRVVISRKDAPPPIRPGSTPTSLPLPSNGTVTYMYDLGLIAEGGS